MKSEFLISGIETGKLNAMVKNIMIQTGITEPEEAVRMVNAGEVQISAVIKSKWIEKDSVIRFSVASDGTTGEQWIARLESEGLRVGDSARSVLRSKDFKPTNGIIYEIAVLRGELFSDSDRISKTIRKEAKNLKLSTPNAEIACLIREKFSDKELEAMSLYWVVAMHEPIKDSDDNPRLLNASRGGNGSWLFTRYGSPDIRWEFSNGFAFVVRQVSVSNF